MYYLFFGINAVVILLAGYVLLFDTDLLATGPEQRVVSLMIVSTLGFMALTGFSAYFKWARHMNALSYLLLGLSWVLVVVFIITFLSRQKWM